MDLHPLLWMMSNVIQQEHKPAVAIDMDEMMVKASGGLYEDPETSMMGVLLRR
jgi:hypothetical protein